MTAGGQVTSPGGALDSVPGALPRRNPVPQYPGHPLNHQSHVGVPPAYVRVTVPPDGTPGSARLDDAAMVSPVAVPFTETADTVTPTPVCTTTDAGRNTGVDATVVSGTAGGDAICPDASRRLTIVTLAAALILGVAWSNAAQLIRPIRSFDGSTTSKLVIASLSIRPMKHGT